MAACVARGHTVLFSPEAGVSVRKLSQLAPLRYLIMLCGISCELAGCEHRLGVHDSRLMPDQTSVNCTIAGLA